MLLTDAVCSVGGEMNTCEMRREREVHEKNKSPVGILRLIDHLMPLSIMLFFPDDHAMVKRAGSEEATE